MPSLPEEGDGRRPISANRWPTSASLVPALLPPGTSDSASSERCLRHPREPKGAEITLLRPIWLRFPKGAKQVATTSALPRRGSSAFPRDEPTTNPTVDSSWLPPPGPAAARAFGFASRVPSEEAGSAELTCRSAARSWEKPQAVARNSASSDSAVRSIRSAAEFLRRETLRYLAQTAALAGVLIRMMLPMRIQQTTREGAVAVVPHPTAL